VRRSIKPIACSPYRSADDNGLPVFDRLRYRRDDRRAFLCAFDLIELNGEDLRREPV
jgi:ATP-dependent DNA ligase